jgi:V/A-type H+-transporting ATPase subunit A
VTAHTQRFVRSLWSLDRDLAYARHYPAVAWSGSYCRDALHIGAWHAAHGDPQWAVRRARVISLLAEAGRLAELADLVGAGALPAHERIVILAGRLLREGVLQQSALSANDASCPPTKTATLIDAVLSTIDIAEELAASGIPATAIEECDFGPLLRAREEVAGDSADGVLRRSAEVADMLRRLA